MPGSPYQLEGERYQMTLIISILDQDYVIVVSDRRVTYRLPDGRITHTDDNRNKAIQYCTRFIITYTGAADVGEGGTDVWLVKHFAAAPSISDGFNRLPEALAERYSDPWLMGRRLAVSGCGWKLVGPRQMVPFSILVSNFRIDNSQLHSEDGATFYTTEYELPGDCKMAMSPLGAKIREQHYKDILRALRRGSMHGVSLMQQLMTLANAIREVANYRETVGRNILVGVMPRAAAKEDDETSMVILSGRHIPHLTTPIFFYLPANSSDPVKYGPHYVCRGTGFTNLRREPL